MSLPPGFLDELRRRVSIARIIGRKVAWDRKKTNTAKGDYWACCPFHHEKTPSFHVDDHKGVYYCFGCQAKGDVITFLCETENLDFREAVEQLAREAGLPILPLEPRLQGEISRNEALLAVNEAAARFWRAQLTSAAAGQAARAYLERRGVGEEARARFSLGYATPGRRVLWEHLVSLGHKPETILEAGLAVAPENGGEPYDRFRDRLIFPIRDARGRIIAFGGRALSTEAPAKYLNSPETPLFSKGRTLFNYDQARKAAASGAPVIVVEGYMDVIALDQAGFAGALAPLGTAITQEQLALLWRLHPEPIIALDGDAAGQRAAMRLIDVALPRLAPGRSLRFAVLPARQDPDDLIRTGGAEAMRALLERAEPLVRVLWQRETLGQSFDTPERRAALEQRLAALAKQIQNPVLRREYEREFRALMRAFFARRRSAPRGLRDGLKDRAAQASVGTPRRRGPRTDNALSPLPQTRATWLASAPATAGEELREARILALLGTYPVLIDEFLHALEGLEPLNPDHAAVQEALLVAKDPNAASDSWQRLRSRADVAAMPLLRQGTVLLRVKAVLAEEFSKLAAERSARLEAEQAAHAIARPEADPGLDWRLRAAAEARHRALILAPESMPLSEITPDDAHFDRILALAEARARKRPRPP